MIVFLHIPKTAGTSFRFVLENTFGVRHCHAGHTRKPTFTQRDFDFTRKIFPGLCSIAGHNLVDPLSLTVPDPFHITFLREPIARAISHYQDLVLRKRAHATEPEPFDKALQRGEELENLHVKRMAGDRNLDKAKRFLEKCNFVGLTEKFDLSLHLLDLTSPYKLNLNFKRKVVARNYSVRDSILADSRLMDMAREHNKLDLALYDFATKEILPRLCQKAGITPSTPIPSHETYANEMKLKYQLGRLYNRVVFRQLCKFAL